MKWLAIILIASCGTKIPKQKIDPAFSSYAEQFEQTYNLNIRSSIIFKKMDKGFAGFCEKRSDGYKEITINPYWWNLYSEEQKQITLWHELGHCELDLGHDPGYTAGCPHSLMFWRVLAPWEVRDCFIPNKEYYLENL
jgi:hypothetical protein